MTERGGYLRYICGIDAVDIRGLMAAALIALGCAGGAAAQDGFDPAGWVAGDCVGALAEDRLPLLPPATEMGADWADQVASLIGNPDVFSGFTPHSVTENDIVALPDESTGLGCRVLTASWDQDAALEGWAEMVAAGFVSEEEPTEQGGGFTLRAAMRVDAEADKYVALVLFWRGLGGDAALTDILAFALPASPFVCGFFPEDCDDA